MNGSLAGANRANLSRNGLNHRSLSGSRLRMPARGDGVGLEGAAADAMMPSRLLN